MSWSEPVLLKGRAQIDDIGSVRLGKGEALVLPLRYEVVSAPSPTRAYAVEGAVRERYENRFDGDGLSPMNRQVVLILFAQETAEQ